MTAPLCKSVGRPRHGCEYEAIFKRHTLTLMTDKQVAEKSMLIKNMMEDLGDSAMTTDVPIPNVSLPPFEFAL